MKRLLLLAALFPGIVIAAIAPDSIAGKVYRDTFYVASLRGASEKTVLFGADGRFVHLKSATVSTIAQPFAGLRVLLDQPRGDGVYVYTRTGDATGTVELRFDDGSKETLRLEFTSASAGGLWAVPAYPDLSFVFSDLAAVQTAPAMNLSLRGRVGPGQPLIAGFVVPGVQLMDGGWPTTKANANQRDILIRVVGPSLSQFGVTGFWADPDFEIFRGVTNLSKTAGQLGEFHYSDWSRVPSSSDATPVPDVGGIASFKKIFNFLGAFALLDDSKDAATVVRLAPGAYTVVCNPVAGDPGGEALLEVYFLP